MKVQVNGKEYKVGWQYDKTPQVRTFNDNRGGVVATPLQGATHCFIKEGDKVVAQGTAYCSLTDQWNKKDARKRTFTRVLANSGFDKVERAIFWQAFFENVHQPNKVLAGPSC